MENSSRPTPGAPDTDRPGPDDPAGGPTRPGRPATALGGPAGRRHRTGPRRHRAGILPPAVLGLTGSDPVPGQPGRRPGVRRAPAFSGVLDLTAGDPTEADDLAGTGPQTGAARRIGSHRRRLVLAGLALTAVLSAVMLVATLVNWAPDGPAPREMTTAERERLAALRVTNYRDLRAGLHVTVDRGTGRTDLLGWVDWARQLIYLDVGGPGAGALRGLAQASPTVLLVRPDPGAVPTPATPPLIPPAEGWRLPADRGLDPLVGLIFALAADRPEPVDGLAGRWVGRERINGDTVDILEGPSPGAGPASTGATAPAEPTGDGRARYWLDAAGRLHRLAVTLPGVGPVSVRLNRADRPTLRPVDALGGRPGLPRALDTAERDRWHRLPARLRAAGGAEVTVTGPVSAGTNLRGAGWLSWTAGTAYLGVTDLDAEGPRTLVRRDRDGFTRIDGPAAGSGAGPRRCPRRRPAGGPHRTAPKPSIRCWRRRCERPGEPGRRAASGGYAATASPAPRSTSWRSTAPGARRATGSTGPGCYAGWSSRPAPAPGRNST
ncbi:hypothetical protein ACQPYA_22550 [Micromonospora sp. CA-263727]|uniref:hypothetical protein n=1 Tax=Micromonospora sp. CA-263727 TaxID=3239967 RepID=UPI003D91056F